MVSACLATEAAEVRGNAPVNVAVSAKIAQTSSHLTDYTHGPMAARGSDSTEVPIFEVANHSNIRSSKLE